jgi:3-oxoacyl-[acyl-carrier-protein] synthase-1
MLKLALAAWKTLQPTLPKEEKSALFLALPERHAGMDFPALEPFLKDFFAQGALFDLAASKVFPSGRAAGGQAMLAAMRALESGALTSVIVGGVDTAVDLMLLNQWHRERRLLTSMSMQGFVPGEGAAFVVLHQTHQAEPAVGEIIIAGAGEGAEPGHSYSDEVCRGLGLMQAITGATQALDAPARTVCCGLTGENSAVKEWGITASKSRALAPDFTLIHPAENFGDLGAATVPTLVALAAQGMRQQTIDSPVVVWASSDTALRSAVSLIQA